MLSFRLKKRCFEIKGFYVLRHRNQSALLVMSNEFPLLPRTGQYFNSLYQITRACPGSVIWPDIASHPRGCQPFRQYPREGASHVMILPFTTEGDHDRDSFPIN